MMQMDVLKNTSKVLVMKQQPASGSNKRPPPTFIYPTVPPETIAIPIVSCIFGFPVFVLTVICCLRRRAKRARERARRRNCDRDRVYKTDVDVSVVQWSPVQRPRRALSLIRSPRQVPSLDLDTVLEEKSDPDQTTLSQVEITPDKEVGEIMLGTMAQTSGDS